MRATIVLLLIVLVCTSLIHRAEAADGWWSATWDSIKQAFYNLIGWVEDHPAEAVKTAGVVLDVAAAAG